jgi:hypothetical protein
MKICSASIMSPKSTPRLTLALLMHAMVGTTARSKPAATGLRLRLGIARLPRMVAKDGGVSAPPQGSVPAADR